MDLDLVDYSNNPNSSETHVGLDLAGTMTLCCYPKLHFNKSISIVFPSSWAVLVPDAPFAHVPMVDIITNAMAAFL